MPNRPRRGNPLQRRATQDVRLSYRPFLQENERMQNAAESVYGALPEEIRNISQGYTGKIGNIGDQFVDTAAEVAGFFPQLEGMPAPEVGAFQGAYGDATTASLGNLASMAGRNAGFNASALRQSGLENRSAQDTLLQQRQQVLQNMAADIRSRVDELREQRLTQQLAKSQMEGDEAFSKYLVDLIGGELNRDNKRDRRRGNGKGKGKNK